MYNDTEENRIERVTRNDRNIYIFAVHKKYPSEHPVSRLHLHLPSRKSPPLLSFPSDPDTLARGRGKDQAKHVTSAMERHRREPANVRENDSSLSSGSPSDIL